MIFFLVFIFILFFNILPILTPPTWMVLSYIAVTFHPNVFLLALTGAVAATIGRLILAKLAKVIVRDKLLNRKTIINLNTFRRYLGKRKVLTFSIFLLYAFGPLPSNQLFLAYGLTGLRLQLIALPFFIGRFVSYLFWIVTASALTHKLEAQTFANGSFIKSYSLIVQALTIAVVYVFTKIDWEKLFTEKRLSWLK